MIVFDAPVSPDALTAFVRRVPVPGDNALLAAAATSTVNDNKVRWSEVTKRNRVAKFRAWDGRIATVERDSAERFEVELPALSMQRNKGEYERLQIEFARVQGGNTEALVNAIYDDAADLTLYALNRLELAIGDVLTDGKLTINENGFTSEADFGVPGTQKVAPQSHGWEDTSNATVLTDLLTWQDAMIANGRRPGAIRTSQAVVRLMQKNKEVIDAVHGSTAGRTLVTIDELNAVLQAHGLPPIAQIYDTVLDVDGVDTRPIPKDRLLMTPANLGDIVEVVFGVTATALDLVRSNLSEMTFQRAAGIVGVVTKAGPPYRESVFVDACAMPILTDPKALLIADVGTIS